MGELGGRLAHRKGHSSHAGSLKQCISALDKLKEASNYSQRARLAEPRNSLMVVDPTRRYLASSDSIHQTQMLVCLLMVEASQFAERIGGGD